MSNREEPKKPKPLTRDPEEFFRLGSLEGNQEFLLDLEKDSIERNRKKTLFDLADLEKNRFAIAQLKFEKQGLPVNIKPFINGRPKCKHYVKTVFGGKIWLWLSVTGQKHNGFEFKSRICTLCGKTLYTKVNKTKE